MEMSSFVNAVEAIVKDASSRGLMLMTCEDESIRGRTVHVNGKELISFSSCSYLGLEHHPALVQGVCDAVQRWGTQFSSSRTYISVTPYEELERKLSILFGGFALVTSTTTLGHQSALCALATEKDALVLDHQVHHSVHLAAQLARTAGTTVEIVRHSRLEQAVERVKQLLQSHEKVWFCCDGVFSMYGDLAPIQLIQELLALSPRVRLYVDDAHGMSWAGKYGRGSFLSRMPQTDQIIVATSLNKAFSAGGGAFIFPTEAERERVRICGGPQMFSGPLQPPMLGAALASVDLHLSDELPGYQQALRERVDFCNRRIQELGMPLLVTNEAPIFFIRMGAPKIALNVGERMLEDGFFVNPSTFPAVPAKRSGIRLALTANHSIEDIDRMLQRLQHHARAVMDAEGVSMLMLDELFARAVPEEARQGSTPTKTTNNTQPAILTHQGLTARHVRTIQDVDPAMWDACMGHVGACSWHAMDCWEKAFQNHDQPESNWDFHYIIVTNQRDQPVCLTFFTTSLIKDDMMMRANISEAVEERRKTDPYFLTSKGLIMGSLCSEGNHLYLDRSGPWQQSLKMALELAFREYESVDAGLLMLRDLPQDDPEMDAFMLEHGFFKTSVLDRHTLHYTWDSEEEWLAQLDRDKRRYVRKYMLQPAEQFEQKIYPTTSHSGALTQDEYDHLFKMYQDVAGQKLRINVFEMPPTILPVLMDSPAWELVTFTLPVEAGGPEDGRPVAYYVGHINGTHYTPFYCGLDYRYVSSHGAYRQLLAQVVRRAAELGLDTIHYGMDADFNKSRLGTQAEQSCAYLQVRDHYQSAILREIVAEVAISK